MKATARGVSTVLTYLGALPFWLLVLPVILQVGAASQLFAAYGSIIAAFMAGALWGGAQASASGLGIIVLSNVLTLASFASVLIGSPALGLSIQMALYLVLLACDFSLLSDRADLRWYLRLRLRVTALVVLSYVVVLIHAGFNVSR